MELNEVKQVYISGIGGIGVSAIARFFVSKGAQVSGSDAVQSEITDGLKKVGVKINLKQEAENLSPDFDLFVYSAAVPADNEERVQAKALGLNSKSYYEILGEISRQYKTISVAGTNGKSTTTAMIASILIDAEKDPTVLVGSQYEKLDANFRAGKSDLFVLETCEYRAHMLLVDPKAIVLTNIEEEHLDFYKDINHIVQTFQQFVGKLRDENNLLIFNNDDINIRKMQKPKCKIVTYGLIHGADLWAERIHKEEGKQKFNVVYLGQNIGQFELNVPGDFNVYNALAAIAYALSLDIPVGVIRDSLKNYKGIWRRFELIKTEEITVVSDYAHHPTAIKGTLKGVKEFFPGRRVIAVFQPHQHDRTKKLFDEFVNSFELADIVVLPEIYSVTGREEDEPLSSKDLVLSILEEDPIKEAYYTENLGDTVATVNPLLRQGDVVVVMGAGDIYQIVDDIKLKEKNEINGVNEIER